MKKVFCLLFFAVLLSFNTAIGQEYQVLTASDSLEVQKRAKELVNDFLNTRSLASLKERKQLKSTENETICFPPSKYCSFFTSPRLISGTSVGQKMGLLALATVATSLGAKPSQLNYGDEGFSLSGSANVTMVVKKVKSSKLTVIYQGKEYKIDTQDRGLENMILLKDREDLLRQISQLYTEAEQKVRQEWQNNLAFYHESVAQFRQGGTGPIAINKGKREYDGTIPFASYNSNNYETFLDETFVFKKKALQKKVHKEQIDNDKIKLLEAMQNDTLGLLCDNGIFRGFISLRTGQTSDYYLLHELLESTTYLNNYSKSAPFNYDGTWSLWNLLYGYCPNTKYPQAVYEALEGEKVYVLKKDDYEEDEIVEISTDRDNKPQIETKKNGVVKIDRIVGVRWYEKLQAMVGKKVVMRTDDGMFYKEDLPKMTVWTIDGIEAKRYNRSGEDRLELDMHLSNGDQKNTINVLEDCNRLTRSLDLSQPVGGDGRTVLSYDYLVKNAPKMPAEVKQEREAKNRFFNALGNAMIHAIKNYDPVKEMKKRAKETHVYECRYCHRTLRAKGKNDFWESGRCPQRSDGIVYPHSWSRID